MTSNPGESRNWIMLEKLRDTDEPFFVLRAQDCLAAALVEEWANRAHYAGVADDIVSKAHMQARFMRQWPKKKIPD